MILRINTFIFSLLIISYNTHAAAPAAGLSSGALAQGGARSEGKKAHDNKFQSEAYAAKFPLGHSAAQWQAALAPLLPLRIKPTRKLPCSSMKSIVGYVNGDTQVAVIRHESDRIGNESLELIDLNKQERLPILHCNELHPENPQTKKSYQAFIEQAEVNNTGTFVAILSVMPYWYVEPSFPGRHINEYAVHLLDTKTKKITHTYGLALGVSSEDPKLSWTSNHHYICQWNSSISSCGDTNGERMISPTRVITKDFAGYRRLCTHSNNSAENAPQNKQWHFAYINDDGSETDRDWPRAQNNDATQCIIAANPQDRNLKRAHGSTGPIRFYTALSIYDKKDHIAFMQGAIPTEQQTFVLSLAQARKTLNAKYPNIPFSWSAYARHMKINTCQLKQILSTLHPDIQEDITTKYQISKPDTQEDINEYMDNMVRMTWNAVRAADDHMESLNDRTAAKQALEGYIREDDLLDQATMYQHPTFRAQASKDLFDAIKAGDEQKVKQHLNPLSVNDLLNDTSPIVFAFECCMGTKQTNPILHAKQQAICKVLIDYQEILAVHPLHPQMHQANLASMNTKKETPVEMAISIGLLSLAKKMLDNVKKNPHLHYLLAKYNASEDLKLLSEK